MEVIILPGATEVGEVAASLVADVVRANPAAVLGLATGSSPLGLYAALGRQVAEGDLSFSRASGFALDEYVGIPADHPQSYAAVIEREVVDLLQFRPSRVHVPDGRASDLNAACVRFEDDIRAAGGVDIQILGVGANGHIGFNEPTSSFASRTRVKTLAPKTIADNARFFEAASDVPIHCLTQGLGTIMDARRLLLVATGAAKAEAIAAIVEGPVSSMWPGSILQHHRHATIIVDAEAARRLELAEYYRHTYANKNPVS
ncbi:MAG: glucosamine-6-phosphate deaminase [Actinomycetota bacterium]|nr:glucosamine-6-phosphate deaminase [Actinomycetota bacterium]